MEQVMRTLPLSEVKAKLSGLVEAVERRDEEVMITRNGRPAAVIVSADEYESWKETREIMADKAFMREIRTGLRAAKRGKLRRYTLDELFGK
jgi:antitoxin YefM